MDDEIKVHKQAKKLYEVIVIPGHVERKESKEFKKSKQRLKDDGHYECWICGSKEDLEVHHYAAAWSLSNVVDFEKLKKFCEEWDPYGYGKLLKNKPIETVDDVRNMLVLCQDHHTGNSDIEKCGTGIHNITFPTWIIQKVAKDELNPVPQDGETADSVMAELEDDK